ncbi:four-carbon acid sugar kinase family protein [Haloferula chungangensis]|uniref:Four-carbon acid sugar kinase family protein n=1 Tax=Haloferula chungangensis TaxID=1048331 RepID=A0ABW2LB66_9BACT
MTRDELLSSLPPEWPECPLASIRRGLEESGETLIVLDDDPTGTQTVYDLPVVTCLDRESIAAALAEKPPVLFLLTNSRSLTADETRTLHQKLGETLRSLGQGRVISRSDSTLRGHYPSETDVLSDALGLGDAITLLAPFFAAGGRLTAGDQHYVLEGEEAVEAHLTPFAKDPVFAFSHSFLPDYIEEKTSGRVRADQVVSLGLELIRKQGPEAVAEKLMAAPARSVVIANAVCQRDIEVVAAGVGIAARKGKGLLARSAASYVQACAGLPTREPLSKGDLQSSSTNGGLVVVGSHVPKTTSQLSYLLERTPDWEQIELDVDQLLASGIPGDLQARLNAALESGRHAILSTSRKLTTGGGDEENLRISATVSAALVEIVSNIPPPRFLIAKGGITSSDIATKALQVRRAMVQGAILPGVPVWKLGEETRFPGLSYVIFPGNVGGDSALFEAVLKLT